MNTRMNAPLLAVLASALCMLNVNGAELEKTAASAELRVMTFNLRYASNSKPNSWPERRPVMKACVRQCNPDLVGTQEGLYGQLKDLASDLPDYTWIGLGRDGGSKGEFMAIFYKRERFEPLEYQHFWLSDTPETIASSHWGNTNRRMVTWVKFLDRHSGLTFYFWNTHLDHAVQLAREKGADLIKTRVEDLKTDLPIVLVGDFNAVAKANPAYDILVDKAGFTDTWYAAQERKNADLNSFHNFRGPSQGGQRIDWILVKGKAQTTSAEIVTYAEGSQYPSDHFPVLVQLKLGE